VGWYYSHPPKITYLAEIMETVSRKTRTHINWGLNSELPEKDLKVNDYQAPFIFTMLSAMFVQTSRACCRGHFEEAVSSKSRVNSTLLPDEVLVFQSNEYGMNFH
jgi:hypothetical protein